MNLESGTYNVTDKLPSYITETPSKHADLKHNPLNILLMGDSVDRYMVEDYCDRHDSPSVIWSDIFVTYDHNCTSTCQIGMKRIAFIQVYGSRKLPPYLFSRVNTPEDLYANTEDRIPQALTKYIALYGTPDYIFYRTELWDFHPRSGSVDVKGEMRNATQRLEEFISNHEWAISLIRSIVPTAYIGSHTVPNIKWGMHLFHHYANSMRYISHKHGTFMYDWNLLLSSHQNYDYLRDGHHPSVPYSVSFAELVIQSLHAWKAAHNISHIHY